MKIHYLLSIGLLFLCLESSANAVVWEFKADLVNSDVIAGGENNSNEPSVGTATFLVTHDPDQPEQTVINYEISAPGIDFDGLQTANLNDDATAIHFHDITTCVAATCVEGDTAGTLHVLNVFGVPRVDDSDMQAFAAEHRVTGIWDGTDANLLTPAPSVAPVEILSQLQEGKLFGMIHTREYPGGAIGGIFKPVPEPSTGCLTWFAISIVALRRRRFRH